MEKEEGKQLNNKFRPRFVFGKKEGEGSRNLSFELSGEGRGGEAPGAAVEEKREKGQGPGKEARRQQSGKKVIRIKKPPLLRDGSASGREVK